MKTTQKTTIVITFVCVLIIIVGFWFVASYYPMPILCPRNIAQEKTEDYDNVTTNEYGETEMRIPSKEELSRMYRAQKLALLEKLGHVPSGSIIADHIIAEQTSWWGKRLDPEEFWKNRVLWYDDATVYSARSRGRAYPPMPYDDPSLHDRSDVDRKSDRYQGESQMPRYVSSEREDVFWSIFRMSNPNPPKHIQRWLDQRADIWLGNKKDVDYRIKTGQSYVAAQRTLENNMFVALRDANTAGFPPECVTPEAFHWDHVMRKRAEYDALVASGKADDEMASKRFFDRVLADRALITEPLTDEQIDAANAWKVAYLKRLRSEEWDESYINAYLEAWNLTEEYVFENEKEQAHEN